VSLTVECQPGRRRRTLHVLLVLLLMTGGWLWFGVSGAALMLLWGEANWPRPFVRHIAIARIAEIRLYGTVLVMREYRGDFTCIFADEMPPDEYAALRRSLKSQLEGLL
jgi:hypothetical protein